MFSRAAVLLQTDFTFQRGKAPGGNLGSQMRLKKKRRSVTQTAARRALFTCPDLSRRCGGDMAAVVDEVSTLLREEHKSPLKTIVAALQTALQLWLRLAGTRLKTLGCCICTASSKKRENLWWGGCWMMALFTFGLFGPFAALGVFAHFCFSSPRLTRGQSNYKQ